MMRALPIGTQRDEQTRVIGLESQFSSDLIGLPIVTPHFTWQVESSRSDAVQIGYEISSIDETVVVTTSLISFNHYAYGAVIDWVYRNVAGIAPKKNTNGYREITFAPRPGQGFTYASAHVDTPLGRAAISWKLTDSNTFIATVTVLFGAKAVLDMPLSATSVGRINGEIVTNKTEVTHKTYNLSVVEPAVVSFKAV